MSDIALKRLLNKVKRDLVSKKEAGAIRRRSNQAIVHKFSMNYDDVVAQIIDVLEKRKYPIDDNVVELVLDGAKNIQAAAWKYVNTGNGRGFNKIPPEDIYGTEKDFSVIIRSYAKVVRGADKRVKSLSYFDSIKEFYMGEVNKTITQLNRYYKNTQQPVPKIQRNNQRNSEGFLDLGHKEGSEIATQKVIKANQALLKGLTNRRSKAGSLSAEQLKVLNLDLSIFKRDGANLDIIEVALESAATNRSKGSRDEKQIVNEFLLVVNKALDNLSENLALFEGSDSAVTKSKKKVLKKVKQNLKKNKKVKVITEDTKIKKSSGKRQTTKLSPKSNRAGKIVQANLAFTGLKQYKEERAKKATYESPIGLQALLNAKLPAKIKENMGYPALENRTGRFAESVKVVDSYRTQKGYPGVSYTYLKNPYQIFEVGAGRDPWSNTQRDPRNLIDRSIREIAAEFITGRFYTRRV